MAGILFKWMLLWQFGAINGHPFYVSVTEVNHNASEKTLEIAVKIFTDDFENTLKKACQCPADLINPEHPALTDSLVARYLKQHLKIKADGKFLQLNYLGYERELEAVWSYIEVKSVAGPPRKIEIVNNLLYDFTDKQINMMHVTVGKKRRSGKLNYPDTGFSVEF